MRPLNLWVVLQATQSHPYSRWVERGGVQANNHTGKFNGCTVKIVQQFMQKVISGASMPPRVTPRTQALVRSHELCGVRETTVRSPTTGRPRGSTGHAPARAAQSSWSLRTAPTTTNVKPCQPQSSNLQLFQISGRQQAVHQAVAAWAEPQMVSSEGAAYR